MNKNYLNIYDLDDNDCKIIMGDELMNDENFDDYYNPYEYGNKNNLLYYDNPPMDDLYINDQNSSKFSYENRYPQYQQNSSKFSYENRYPQYQQNSSKFSYENRYPQYQQNSSNLTSLAIENKIKGDINLNTEPDLINNKKFYNIDIDDDVVKQTSMMYMEMKLNEENKRTENDIFIYNRPTSDYEKYHNNYYDNLNSSISNNIGRYQQSKDNDTLMYEFIESNNYMNYYTLDNIKRHNDRALMIERTRIFNFNNKNNIKQTYKEVNELAYNNLVNRAEAKKKKLEKNILEMSDDERLTITLQNSQDRVNRILINGINTKMVQNPYNLKINEELNKQEKIVDNCKSDAELVEKIGSKLVLDLERDKIARKRFDVNSTYNRSHYNKLSQIYGDRDRYGNIINQLEGGEYIDLDDIEINIKPPSLDTINRKEAFIRSIQADDIPQNIINELNYERELAKRYGDNYININETIPINNRRMI